MLYALDVRPSRGHWHWHGGKREQLPPNKSVSHDTTVTAALCIVEARARARARAASIQPHAIRALDTPPPPPARARWRCWSWTAALHMPSAFSGLTQPSCPAPRYFRPARALDPITRPNASLLSPAQLCQTQHQQRRQKQCPWY